MTYEEKRITIVKAIIDASKFVISDESAVINPYRPPLKDIPTKEIDTILKQFQHLKKLKVISVPLMYISGDKRDFIEDDGFEIKILDMGYFKDQLPKKTQMQILNDTFDRISGRTAIERAELEAIRNKYKADEESPINHYFIKFNDDRKIMLNGKIEIGRPQFGRPSHLLFEFLYNNQNKTFTKTEIEENIKTKFDDTITKTLDRMGFRRGLRTAFFDIHHSKVKDEETVKFRNPVTL